MANEKPKHSRKKVIAAIKGSGGIKMLIAQRLKSSRNTFDRYLQNDEHIQKAYEAECDDVGDMVESKILSAIKGGSETMCIFYAKTKMKNRGYVERQEVDNIRPIILKVDKDDAQA